MKGWNNTRLKNLLNEPLLYGLNVSSEYEERDMPRYIRITDFDDFNNLVEVVDRKGVTMFNNYNIVAIKEGNQIYGTFLKPGDLQLEGFDYGLKRA